MASPLKTLGLAAAFFFAIVTSSLATGSPFWRCELPGGVFMVSLSTLCSVSTHEYIVDGTARVTELTVGTFGAVVGRFYYLEPMIPQSPVGIGQTLLDKAQQQARDAATRTGMEAVWQKVIKNYPATTHAHTVEYRLETLDQLKRVQKSLEDAWRANQDTQFKISSDDASTSGTSGN